MTEGHSHRGQTQRVSPGYLFIGWFLLSVTSSGLVENYPLARSLAAF